MTIKRAVKGWQTVSKHTDYSYKPSNNSQIRGEALKSRTTLSIKPSDYKGLFIIEEDFDFSNGAVVTLHIDNRFSREIMKEQLPESELYDKDEKFELKIEIETQTQKGAEAKAKEIMKKIQTEEDLINFFEEKRKQLPSVQVEAPRRIEKLQTLIDNKELEKEIERTTRKITLISNNKERLKIFDKEKMKETLEKNYQEQLERIRKAKEVRAEKINEIKPKFDNLDKETKDVL